jgi:citrate lyase subunit beta / citryl-CoA lyase
MARLLPRSWLFVPADRPDRVSKALLSSAEALIIDLEDSIAHDAKITTREGLREMLRGSVRKNVFVRINEITSEWFEDDVRALDGLNVAGVVLPRTNSADDVKSLAAILQRMDTGQWIVPLIESAPGVYFAREVAQSSPQVLALAFGAGDYSLDIGIPKWPTGEQLSLLVPRVMVILAARIANLGALDTPTPTFRDPESVREQSLLAVSLGFQGKLAIHPTQIDTINSIFRPDAAALKYAQRVVATFKASLAEGRASTSVDGKLVTGAIAKQSYALIERASDDIDVGRGPRAASVGEESPH